HVEKEPGVQLTMGEELTVSLPVEAPRRVGPLTLLKEIWREITFGIGVWGSARPLFTVLLAAVPFLFLGQHINREHRKGIDFGLLQIPLALTVLLWIGLYLWSIFDAWRAATAIVARGGLTD
ncbi:MAG: hypothetical protein VXZ64_01085, partial [Candidatus Thermoplasmatota archaeon]|nr:hypothetical protein [Candidatus Thermoplasmatota archaeon]